MHNITQENTAAVFMTFASGHDQKGPMFYMPLEDAQAFCSSEIAHGTARGGHWCMVFIRLQHYGECYPKPCNINKWQQDRGDFTEYCEEQGLQILDREEVNKWLEEHYDELYTTYNKECGRT